MGKRFRKWLAVQDYTIATEEKYIRVVRALNAFLKNKSLRDVTPMDIGDFLTRNLPLKWTDDHVNQQLGALRSFFDFLYLGGVVDSVAPRFLRARKRVAKLPRTITPVQMRKMIAAADNIRDRALLEMFYATGCRVGEISRMRVEDVDFRRSTVRVRAKRKERVVFFGAPAKTVLREYLGSRKTGFLFQDIIPGQHGYITHNNVCWTGCWRDFRPGKDFGKKYQKYLGTVTSTTHNEAKAKFALFLRGGDLNRPKPDRPLTRSTLGKLVQDCGRRIGILTSPHVIRHSFATHLLEQGADIRVIQELLGHTYLTSTQVYTRVSNKMVATAFRRFHPRAA
jgi:integrase/recombinase XerC